MKAALRRSAGALFASLVALPGVAGPYDQPYSLFQADGRSPTRDTSPATVMKIDGKNNSVGRPDPIAPGMHTIEVSIPGPRGMSNPRRDTLEIDAKPCTRYYLSAKRSSPTDDDWKAFVSFQEPIGECAKKFPATKQGK